MRRPAAGRADPGRADPGRADPGPDRDAASSLDALRRIVRALRVAARRTETATGLSAAQLFVLRLVAATPGLSLTDLAARTLTDRTSVAAMIERLGALGLVERRPSAEDRRRAAIVATPAGRAIVAQAPDAPTQQVLDGIAALDDVDRRCLAVGLGALVRAMGLAGAPAPMLFEDAPEGGRGPRRRGGASR